MSRTFFTDLLMIVLLIALQIFVLNRITLFGKYTPVFYIFQYFSAPVLCTVSGVFQTQQII